jgi:hypothetical protein
MNSAFGTHLLLQQRTLHGISDSLDWLGVFHHTASERAIAMNRTKRGERHKYECFDCWQARCPVTYWDKTGGTYKEQGHNEGAM